jgi:hypothetical protein
MILASHGLIGSQIASFVGLLDLYPSAAAAYSLRKLRTAYSGSAIRVRRSSDNTEQDIGFANNVLDTSALTTFCGANNGFVTTWYDQSGNGNNGIQTTAANQPQIVSSGSIITQNGKPSLLFDGTNDNFLSNAAIDPLFITAINTPNTTSVNKTIMGADASGATQAGAIYLQYGDPTRIPGFSRKTVLDSSGLSDFSAKGTISESNNTTNLITGTRTSTNIQVYINNISKGSDTTIAALNPLGNTDAGRFRLMAGYYNRAIVDFMNGNLTEFIAYTSDQSSNRTAINTNINSYYGIY